MAIQPAPSIALSPPSAPVGTLSAWHRYIDQLHPEDIALGLPRVAAVAQRLGCQHFTGQVVTVAGTNGKGSAVAVLEALARAAGILVGAYTSPHLLHFNERLRINGVELDDGAWCEAFAAVDQARGQTVLTAFEFETVAALWLLARHRPQLLLLEVGLGGRLDAVAIVPSQLVLLNCVELDHERWLGDNREAIGAEKSALFSSNCAVVYGDLDPPQSVLQRAQQLAVRWHGLGQQYHHETADGLWHWRGVDRAGGALCSSVPAAPCLDANSVSAALQAWFLLCPDARLDAASAVAVATATRLAGRRQSLFRDGVHYLLDVAHNPAAAIRLAAVLPEFSDSPPAVVLGMMEDKNHRGFINALRGSVGAWCVAELPTPRAAPASTLAACLGSLGADVHGCDDVPTALARAGVLAGAGASVLVTGSFVTVAEALRQLEATADRAGAVL